MVTAHYDSVPAGPGAADNGIGIAVLLEIAAQVKSILPYRKLSDFLYYGG